METSVSLPLPIIVNKKTSLFLGRLPASADDRPIQVVYPDVIAGYFSDILKDAYGYVINLAHYAVVSGAFSTNIEYFRSMANYEVLTSEKVAGDASRPQSFKQLRIVVNAFASICNFSHIIPPRISNIWKLRIKPTANPGFRLTNFCGLFSKEKAVKGAMYVLFRYWNELGDKFIYPNHFYAVGAREKRISPIKEGEPIKTRGVFMPEMWLQLFDSLLCRPFEKMIHSSACGPIYLGHSMAHGGWRRFRDDLNYGEVVLEGDFKGYDTTLPENLMVAAYSMIYACYPKIFSLKRRLATHLGRII